jgi:hypothetical protein
MNEHPSVIALSSLDRTYINELIFGSVYIWSGSDSKLKLTPHDDTLDASDLEDVDPQPTAGDAVTFCELVAKGKTTYLSPSFTWEKTWESELPISGTTLNNLGKVDTPDGSPPTPSGGRNWMLIDERQEKRGLLYRNRQEWALSERGGWDSDVYDY